MKSRVTGPSASTYPSPTLAPRVCPKAPARIVPTATPSPADHLTVIQERLGIVQQELDQPAPRNAGLLLHDECVAADEATGLVELDRETEARLERCVEVADVVPEVAVRLLEAQAAERLEPRVLQSVS